MIRAPGIFRSVTFWSGILVMAFIGWAWKDSCGWRTTINAFPHARLTHGAGGTAIVALSGRGRLGSHQRSAIRMTKPWWQLEPPFLYQLKRGQDDMRKGTTGGLEPAIIIPHWLLLLAFAVLWFRLLYWRHRRIRKAAIPAPPPP